jgi:hypothetical protein
MPSHKKVVAAGDVPELSQRDLQVIALAWACLKTDPHVRFHHNPHGMRWQSGGSHQI